MHSSSGLVLDRMRVEDLDAVMEIERRSFPEPWTPGLFLHELKLPFSTTLVARRIGRPEDIVGYVCWWLVGDEVHLLNVAVTPEVRRDGIGRALVQVLIDAARVAGAGLVTLEVRHDNEPGIALYRSFGFEQVGLRKHYYGRGHHAVIMSRKLERDLPTGGAASGPTP